MARFDGKTALITGGSSGIGLATAKALMREGARVMINGHNQAGVDKGLSELPHGAIGVAARVERLADIDRLMEAVKSEWGGLDILVLCVGVMRVAPTPASQVGAS